MNSGASVAVRERCDTSRRHAVRVTEVEQLRGLYPLLEQLQVTQFRDNGACKYMAYARGEFTTQPSEPSCTHWDSRIGQAFDPQVVGDADRLAVALRATGVAIVNLEFVESDEGGHIKSAEFDLEGGSQRLAYVFDKAGDVPPGSKESEYQPIAAGWFLWIDDPN
jgi:hypothetical protein